MLREQLSALADDELEHGEIELLLRRYADNRELRVCWSTWHVIGEAMRRGRPALDACRIAERVSAALNAEGSDAATHPSIASGRRWMKVLRPIGAVAIAASVGVVAILVVRGQMPGQLAGAGPAQVVPPQASAPRVGFNYAAVSSVRWDQGSPQVRRELNEYLFDHNQDAPTLGREGMLPYVHLATLYAGPPPEPTPHREAGKSGGR